MDRGAGKEHRDLVPQELKGKSSAVAGRVGRPGGGRHRRLPGTSRAGAEPWEPGRLWVGEGGEDNVGCVFSTE